MELMTDLNGALDRIVQVEIYTANRVGGMWDIILLGMQVENI
jgi:hypothetical protein